jgi:hypothetical protein
MFAFRTQNSGKKSLGVWERGCGRRMRSSLMTPASLGKPLAKIWFPIQKSSIDYRYDGEHAQLESECYVR